MLISLHYIQEKRKRMEKARSEYDTAMSKHRQLCKKKGAEPDLLMAVRVHTML